MVDVKSAFEAAPISSFIGRQGVDGGAAFKRHEITKATLEKYRAEINATNTVDVVGELKSLYDQLESTMKLIILHEEQLIAQSK